MLQVKDLVTKRVVREAADNSGKGQLFYETFFPPPNPAPAAVLHDYQYPPQQWTFMNVTDKQSIIHQVIKKMKPYKATRSGTVSNLVLIHAREELVPHLAPLPSYDQVRLLPTRVGTHRNPDPEEARKTGLHIPSSMAPYSTLRWNSLSAQQLPDRQHCYHVQEV
ncbi:hypothetical protein L208DRAFT_1271520 [Tricholoma matsutake]|nr:hypothetical protein L208DRAFT_1271520 [Tricholoma matsutake 945]